MAERYAKEAEEYQMARIRRFWRGESARRFVSNPDSQVILIAAAIVVAVMVVQNAKPKAVESRGRAG